LIGMTEEVAIGLGWIVVARAGVFVIPQENV
jgi:hypothetical protein